GDHRPQSNRRRLLEEGDNDPRLLDRMPHRGALGREERSQVPLQPRGEPRRSAHDYNTHVMCSFICRERAGSAESTDFAPESPPQALGGGGRAVSHAGAGFAVGHTPANARCCSPVGSVSKGRSMRSLTIGPGSGSPSAASPSTTSGVSSSGPRTWVTHARVIP